MKILRPLAIAAAVTGLVLGGTAGAEASATHKTAGCRPPQSLLHGHVISVTATASPYPDRWITRKIVVSATKSYGDVYQEWWLKSITVQGYKTVNFGQTDGSGGSRVIRYTSSTPRDIKVVWNKDKYLPFTGSHPSCTIKGF